MDRIVLPPEAVVEASQMLEEGLGLQEVLSYLRKSSVSLQEAAKQANTIINYNGRCPKNSNHIDGGGKYCKVCKARIK